MDFDHEWVPFIFISGENAIELCIFLLENGANPNQGCILSKVLKHSLNYSYDRGRYLIEKCLECGANLDVYDNTPNLMLAIASKDINLMKKMIEGGANVNAQDTEGNTSLQFALSTSKYILVGGKRLFLILFLILDSHFIFFSVKVIFNVLAVKCI